VKNNELPVFTNAARAEDIASTLLESGAVIVADFLARDTLDAFNREMDGPLSRERPDRQFMTPDYDYFFGTRTRHLTGLSGRSEIFREQIMRHALYSALCETILLPHCATYQFNYGHVFEIAPGARRQPLHRDGDCWSYLPVAFDVEVASIVALSDFTADNGATLVIPGSHRWPREKALDYSEALPAVMPAGAALLYLGGTAHAAGDNRTTQDLRRGMHVSFCLGWLRTEENNYLVSPIEEVRKFPRRTQELLGYQAHDASPAGGCLGVYNMLDPVELMSDDQFRFRGQS
jgi:ectoine hydroxylase-related dioxygenase (phytanoyl-CoA dioxygenase family)